MIRDVEIFDGYEGVGFEADDAAAEPVDGRAVARNWDHGNDLVQLALHSQEDGSKDVGWWSE